MTPQRSPIVITLRRVLWVASALTCALSATACATKYASAALGQYEEYQVFGRPRGVSIEVELARPAHVAVINVRAPAPGYQDRPVLFSAAYPLYESDRTFFGAGRHRLVPRRTTVRVPLNCGERERPTVEGCRRPRDHYPGVHPGETGVYVDIGPHYIILASDSFIDPFTVADELVYLSLEREDLARALRARDAHAAASLLERALLDRPGSPEWAALYVTSR